MNNKVKRNKKKYIPFTKTKIKETEISGRIQYGEDYKMLLKNINV